METITFPQTNSIAWVNQVKVNTTPPSSGLMWFSNPVPLNLLFGGGGCWRRQTPNLQGTLIDWCQKRFLSATHVFSLPKGVDVVWERETHSPLPKGPTRRLHLACFLWSLPWRLICPKSDLQVPYCIPTPLFWPLTSAYDCIIPHSDTEMGGIEKCAILKMKKNQRAWKSGAWISVCART